jgi:hypothetical protein
MMGILNFLMVLLLFAVFAAVIWWVLKKIETIPLPEPFTWVWIVVEVIVAIALLIAFFGAVTGSGGFPQIRVIQ